MRSFKSLTEQEVLALAISLEEEHAKIYDSFAESLRKQHPMQAERFSEMRKQEDAHRHRLLEVYQKRFGDHLPLIRRDDVRGFVKHRPVWLHNSLGLKTAEEQAEMLELETQRFYEAAISKATDVSVRQLLGDLAEEERNHVDAVGAIKHGDGAGDEPARKKRLFALQVIQPGLAGLMDGSVSTLAPLFAAAFATHSSWSTFRVGLAASLGAGISMGFAEALSDDGKLTGRGHPWARGLVCGAMTGIGGIGHTIPYLIKDIKTATAIAIGVVCVELGIISWVRHKYMDSPISSAVLQIVLGGVLVFAVGILIGMS
jgi:rubrerythrin